jgi:hypothetical protein
MSVLTVMALSTSAFAFEPVTQLTLKQTLSEFVQRESLDVKSDTEIFNELNSSLSHLQAGQSFPAAIKGTGVGTAVISTVAGVIGIFQSANGARALLIKISGVALMISVASVIGGTYYINLSQAEIDGLNKKMGLIKKNIESRIQSLNELRKQLNLDDIAFDSTLTVEPGLSPQR